jgi:hypothetical protein
MLFIGIPCVLFLHIFLIMSEYNIQILVYLTAGVMFRNIYTYVYHLFSYLANIWDMMISYGFVYIDKLK